MSNTRSCRSVATPSSWTKNYVFTRRTASVSPSIRVLSNESISSTNTTLGCLTAATANTHRTNFYPSPIHLDMIDEEEMLIKVQLARWAIARAIIVLPVPGGPKSNNPRGGSRSPVKRSGRFNGQTMAYSIVRLACCKPAISSQPILLLLLLLLLLLPPEVFAFYSISYATCRTSEASSGKSNGGTLPSGRSNDAG